MEPTASTSHIFYGRAISPLHGILSSCSKEAGGRQKKNTLQEDYIHCMPRLLQEFVMLHLVCKCGQK